jgi:hypothetical protein
LNVLSQTSQSLPATTILELSQMIIFTIKISSELSSSFIYQFEANNGYTIIADNLVLVARIGTREERVKKKKFLFCKIFFNFRLLTSLWLVIYYLLEENHMLK